MTATNFLLTYQQNCYQEKQSVPCGKYFFKCCVYVLVVFKISPCGTMGHWVFLRQVTYSPD